MVNCLALSAVPPTWRLVACKVKVKNMQGLSRQVLQLGAGVPNCWGKVCKLSPSHPNHKASARLGGRVLVLALVIHCCGYDLFENAVGSRRLRIS
jgi:hypothetical protein